MFQNYKLKPRVCNATKNINLHNIHHLRCAPCAPGAPLNKKIDVIASRQAIDWRYGDDVLTDRERIVYRLKMSNRLYSASNSYYNEHSFTLSHIEGFNKDFFKQKKYIIYTKLTIII